MKTISFTYFSRSGDDKKNVSTLDELASVQRDFSNWLVVDTHTKEAVTWETLIKNAEQEQQVGVADEESVLDEQEYLLVPPIAGG